MTSVMVFSEAEFGAGGGGAWKGGWRREREGREEGEFVFGSFFDRPTSRESRRFGNSISSSLASESLCRHRDSIRFVLNLKLTKRPASVNAETDKSPLTLALPPPRKLSTSS